MTTTWTENNNKNYNERPDWLASEDDENLNKKNGTLEGDTAVGDTVGVDAGGINYDSPLWRKVLFYTVSLILFGLFVYSAVVQNNDNDAVLWYLFYSLNAILAAVVLLHCFFPPKLVYILSTVMIIFSIVLMIVSAIDLSNLPENEGNNNTNVNGHANKREEVVLELAGTCIAFAAALYHGIVIKYTETKKKNNDTTTTTPTSTYVDNPTITTTTVNETTTTSLKNEAIANDDGDMEC